MTSTTIQVSDFSVFNQDALVFEQAADPGVAWCTYTKVNTSGLMYMGRTSGRIGADNSILTACDRARRRRDREHEKGRIGSRAGWGAAIQDRPIVEIPVFSRGIFYYGAIRGREQQLIDSKGGPDPFTANQIRGVSQINPAGCIYWLDSTLMFPPSIAGYTGLVPRQCFE